MLTHIIPHALSLSRIVCAIALWVNPAHTMVLGCIIWGGISDWADGFLARKWKVASRFGALLDPICDKVLIANLVILLAYQGLLPTWWFSLALSRDALILLGGLIAMRFYSITDMPPTFASKLNTALQLIVLALVVWPLWSVSFMMMLSAITTIVSGAQYAKFFGRMVAKRTIL